MSVSTQVGINNESFERFLATRDEPAWLGELRRAAWAKYGELPTPSRRDEEWMRTDIRLFRPEKFGFAGEPTAIDNVPTGLLTAGVELGGQATAVDSRPHQSRLAEKWSRQGVLFGSLDELVAEHGDLVRKFLFRAVDDEADGAHGAEAQETGTFLAQAEARRSHAFSAMAFRSR